MQYLIINVLFIVICYTIKIYHINSMMEAYKIECYFKCILWDFLQNLVLPVGCIPLVICNNWLTRCKRNVPAV